ncbi:hypothetical protein PYCCODRAFT_1427197 [Trametes coccinea BRFM310]|uniref:Uncharacterized protein n=1 Tax=Trametes coccinea (strain BRFM310) TaxID=1353009 RepID=A0A1Y2IDY5_TRAC3|nr:hypothetical protein PYCCODRAFT_1427197 [Trametes coccinea BRFM310]
MAPPSRAGRRDYTKYTFSASADIMQDGTTHMPFAAPRAPFSNTLVSPIILRRFCQTVPNLKSAGEDARPQAQSISRASSVVSRRSSPVVEIPSRHPTPVPHSSRQSSRQPTPAPPQTRSQTPVANNNSPDVGGGPEDTATGTIRALSVPPEDFGAYLPPMELRSASTRSHTTTPSSSQKQRASSTISDITTHEDGDPSGYHRITRLCQLTDEEKLAYSNRKGKAQERFYTAWIESTAEEPRLVPPDLTSIPNFSIGDIFWHKSSRGIQLWIWADTPQEGKHWKPVSADSR